MITVYADGGYGGVSPRGMISVALYSERNPIPQLQEIEVDDAGKIVDTKTLESRDGIVRHVECELVMTPEAAKSVGQWLIDKADLVLKGEKDE